MANNRKPFGDLLNVVLAREVTVKHPTNDDLSSVNVISERNVDLPLGFMSWLSGTGTSEDNPKLNGSRCEAKKRKSRRPNLGKSRILYILRCRKCKKIYTGETTYTLAEVRSRFISEVQRGASKRKVAKHFLILPCGLQDMEFLEKKQIGHTDIRVNQKRKLIQKLNSKDMGLNSVTPRKRRVDGRSNFSGDKKQVANQQDIRNYFNVIKRNKSSSKALQETRD